MADPTGNAHGCGASIQVGSAIAEAGFSDAREVRNGGPYGGSTRTGVA